MRLWRILSWSSIPIEAPEPDPAGAAGMEPASESASPEEPTCVSGLDGFAPCVKTRRAAAGRWLRGRFTGRGRNGSRQLACEFDIQSRRAGRGGVDVRGTAPRYTGAVDFRLQRVLRITDAASHASGEGARRYWLSRPPAERLAAVEFLRRQHDGTGARLQRVLRLVDRPRR